MRPPHATSDKAGIARAGAHADTAVALHFDLHAVRGAFALRATATLAPGITGIVGASGAGKSTLLALLAGLLRPTSGTLRIGQTTLINTARGVCLPPWQRHLGLVFQDGQLFPHRSVRSNLLYGHARLRREQRRYALEDVVALLELGALLDRRPALLSGGERQRVALGRALLYSPRALLLDEPLSSLDTRLKQQILPFLARIRDETGLPMLYVSHAHEEVDALTDRVLTMHDGTLSAAEHAWSQHGADPGRG